jgi:ribosomal-protein-alanine N-acetyltransferase
MIKYRFASLEDFDEVEKIENECFIEPYSTEDLHYEFEKNPVNKIIVAEDDGKVVGFIDYLITFNSSTIMQVAVTKMYRRYGIATQLLSEMEKSFPKNIDDLVETITLEVRESNEAAKNLYLKNGYKIVVIKNHYYKDGENAIYMLKRL